MGTAAVLGLQGTDGAAGPNTYLGSPKSKVIAQAKHFFAYDWGGRDGAAALLDERSLHQIFARPWKRAIEKAGLRGVMASHNAVNWEPMHGSHRWLTSYLREELGFGEGYIGADSHNVVALFSGQKVVASVEDAAKLAVTAGLDQDLNTMVGTPYLTLIGQNKTAELSASIDRAAGNVLRLKFAAGLFDAPTTDASLWPERDSAAARTLARRAAEEGVVMLINRDNTLPLSTSPSSGWPRKKLAVLGPNADQKDNMLGDYNPGARASEAAWAAGSGGAVVTVLAGLEAYTKRAGVDVTVATAQGCSIATGPATQSEIDQAVALHEASDATVLVIGDSTANSAGFSRESCGEGADRQSLDVFGQQMELLEALAASNSTSKLIVVLIHGRPATFGPGNAVLAKVDALFAAWRPGEEGGAAIARLLFGEVSPSGKLTQAWLEDAGGVRGPGNP